jgi:hypothetical protein
VIDSCYIGDVRDGLRATFTELAYCAGVIDSDGTIGVKCNTYSVRVIGDSKQPTYSERICVKQVEPEAVDLLSRIFGGTRYHAAPSVKRGKWLYVWQVTDLKAARCLAALLPHLRIKAEQARNCLALRLDKEISKGQRVAYGRGHVGAAARSPELSQTMEARYQRAKELNRVGVD